ncbi:MAG: D-alanyl-D-alanine carboxypeptidase [Clostridia bacterium]|nr:D-alanyl-D-alanine carboxypeptidase [Clostridia bacterium]
MIGNRIKNKAIAVKIFVKIMIIAVILFSFPPIFCYALEPHITARSAIIYDRKADKILYEKNAHEKRPPASTTKVMTGILTIELSSLNEEVVISKKAALTGGASIYLSQGERFTVKDLVLGTMIRSGNDAAVSLAEAVGGSEEFFIELMNRKAVLLGALNTHFENPHGLPDENHYSTAYDLAKITDYALDNPFFASVVKTEKAEILEKNTTWKRYIKNTNLLLGKYPGINGVKTGTTNKAGQCLIASATRGNHWLISVVLKSRDRYGDTKELLEYGFNQYKNFYLPKGMQIGKLYFFHAKPYQVNLVVAEDCSYTISRDMASSLNRELIINNLKLPLKKGEIVGYLKVTAETMESKKIPVAVEEAVRPTTLPEKIKSKLRNMTGF